MNNTSFSSFKGITDMYVLIHAKPKPFSDFVSEFKDGYHIIVLLMAHK